MDAVSCQHCAGTKDCKEGFVFLHFGSCYCAAANLKEMVDEKWAWRSMRALSYAKLPWHSLQGHGWLQCVGTASPIPMLGLWDGACWQPQPGAGFWGQARWGCSLCAYVNADLSTDSSLGWIKPCMVVALVHFKTVLIYIWIPMGHSGWAELKQSLAGGTEWSWQGFLSCYWLLGGRNVRTSLIYDNLRSVILSILEKPRFLTNPRAFSRHRAAAVLGPGDGCRWKHRAACCLSAWLGQPWGCWGMEPGLLTPWLGDWTGDKVLGQRKAGK